VTLTKKEMNMVNKKIFRLLESDEEIAQIKKAKADFRKYALANIDRIRKEHPEMNEDQILTQICRERIAEHRKGKESK